jgi:hypothetical protein
LTLDGSFKINDSKGEYAIYYDAVYNQMMIIKQVRGFAPIGMVECWNIGKMGLGILQYWVNGKIRLGDKV